MEALFYIIVYLLVSVSLAIFLSLRVTKSEYQSAGGKLSIAYMIAIVSVGWLGAGSILGGPANFIDKGIGGIAADPFGATLCLIIVALLFTKKLRDMNIVSIGELYKLKFGPKSEAVASFLILTPYIGWLSGQVIAMGLMLEVLSNGAISIKLGMVLGSIILCSYASFGGMAALAIIDYFQMMVIIISLTILSIYISYKVGGSHAVFQYMHDKHLFSMPKDTNTKIQVLSGAMVMCLGSIPQQDLLQKVISAIDIKTAIISLITGSIIYLIICLVPPYLAAAVSILDPDVFNKYIHIDPQLIMPYAIINNTPIFLQTIFFGAVMACIMSSGGSAIVAASVIISENAIKPRFNNLSDSKTLMLNRISSCIFCLIVLIFSLESNASIYYIVVGAYKLTLVGPFSPMLFAILFKKPMSEYWSIAAMIIGVISSMLFAFINIDPLTPEILGLSLSMLASGIGTSLAYRNNNHRIKTATKNL